MIFDARREYGDIIDLEHHVSENHPQMSRLNRAAQFSPFAALTGYEDLIAEAARWTTAQAELDESSKEEISRRLNMLLRMKEPTTVTITYFMSDNKKLGGQYQTVSGIIQKYDDFGRYVQLQSGDTVFLDDIYAINADVFDEITT